MCARRITIASASEAGGRDPGPTFRWGKSGGDVSARVEASASHRTSFPQSAGGDPRDTTPRRRPCALPSHPVARDTQASPIRCDVDRRTMKTRGKLSRQVVHYDHDRTVMDGDDTTAMDGDAAMDG